MWTDEHRAKYRRDETDFSQQFSGLSLKTFQDYPLDEFRELLGVPPGRYRSFGEFNKHVLKPAVAEVNALAPFTISVLPIKQGKKVTQIKIGWWPKDSDAVREAFDELQRSRVGRRARISGTVEAVADPAPHNRRPVLSTNRCVGAGSVPERGRGNTCSSVSARRHRVIWSGMESSRPSRRMIEMISPSV